MKLGSLSEFYKPKKAHKQKNTAYWKTLPIVKIFLFFLNFLIDFLYRLFSNLDHWEVCFLVDLSWIKDSLASKCIFSMGPFAFEDSSIVMWSKTVSKCLLCMKIRQWGKNVFTHTFTYMCVFFCKMLQKNQSNIHTHIQIHTNIYIYTPMYTYIHCIEFLDSKFKYF